MVCELDGIYKGIKEIKGGSFVNEKGETINYNDCYRLRFDQIIGGLPKETELKISKELALNVAKNFQLYDKIVIKFNIIIYNSNTTRFYIDNIKKI